MQYSFNPVTNELNKVLTDFYKAASSIALRGDDKDFSFAAMFIFQKNVDRFLETVRHYFSKNHYICNDTITDLYRGTGDPKCYIVDIYAEKEPEYMREKK